MSRRAVLLGRPVSWSNPSPAAPREADGSAIVRVAMVITSWNAQNVGGAERQIESLCPELVRRGVRPVIIGRLRRGVNASYDSSAEVVHVRVPGIPGIDSVLFVVGALRALAKVRPDVVHAFSAFSQSTIALFHKRRTGTPFLTKILRSGPLGDLQRLQAKLFGKRRVARLVNEADGFVVISQEVDDELAALGVEPERRLRIPNGVDVARFAPTGGETDEPSIASDGPVVVAVGRLSPEKRMRELSEHWHLVRAEHPDATLLIVGKRATQVDPNAVRLAPDRHIVHLGTRDDVENVYRSSDVYVSASVAEGLSNALLEAMATGLPCVVTRTGGVGDVVADGRNGLVVPPDDLPALCDGINKLLADPSFAQELGARARETVIEGFSLTRIADALAAEYHRLATGAHTS